MSGFDIVVNNGLWFDGTGVPGLRRNLGIRDGVVAEVSIDPLLAGPDTEVIDAADKWVLPGFVDVHTHYDAEVLVSPGLPESVRHGVTTVVLGSCSLSTVYSTPQESADLFSRVEAVPHDAVLRILQEKKTWTGPAAYAAALDALPLSPNVAAFIGHSGHRNFYDAVIVGCPDETLIGKNFGEVGDIRGVHPVDAYLDLVVKYGKKLRWRTTIANHRPKYAKKLASSSGVQMGFGDVGAHLRNMAFYNYPVRLLKRVNDAQGDRKPFLTVERAIHRLTGELADWYGLDAGHLRKGDRADLVVIDPAGFDESVEGLFEATVPEYNGISRMVNRSDGAAVATVINGRLVYRDGAFAAGFGIEKTGRFLRAGENSPAMESVRASVAP
ncbi:amidohydrolase family protein [Rhodococcus sp. IEGM 1379]|uniref:amidohydrolase family protein n=1 Tax=Rhodococcus sp. IEGM 1379 TaxID=3047086 RepID=UPI0024B6DA03|nr:amidohydrolase family protein [Rhodococcus sp. IEGM 1379]MDI9917829.1 amidohydrolase family protein [Rhodococcus sp. IEGM 1379]